MQLIIFSGIPGTGKSTLAEALGRELNIPVFAFDWLLGSLKPFGILTGKGGQIGEALLTTLAQRQLLLGQSAILDSSAHHTAIRTSWHDLAMQHKARFCAIVTVCSDRRLHRTRVEGRKRGIPGWHELNWAHVERMRDLYEPWSGEHLVIDAVNPLDKNIQEIIAYIQGTNY
jgi:predicted kinase